MNDTEDRGGRERGGSLLSLGRAIEEERARTRGLAESPANESVQAGIEASALERHQRARARREARQSAILEGLSSSAAGPAMPAKPTPIGPSSAEPAASKSRSLLGRLWSSGERGHPAEIRPAAPQPAASIADPVARSAGSATLKAPATRAVVNVKSAAERLVERPAASPTPATSSAAGRRVSDSLAQPMYVTSGAERVASVQRQDEAGWTPLIDPMKVIGGIARSKGIILATTLLGAVLGVGMALSTPKKYDAFAELLVDPRPLKIGTGDLTEIAGLPSDATLAIVENQARILTSSNVLNAVADKLNLESDPEFNGEEGGIELNPLNFVRSLLSRSDNSADAGRRRGLTIQHLAESLSVERTGKTFVIVIRARTNSGEKSALVANAMMDEFRAIAGQMQSDTAGRATDELTQRLDELRKNVEDAERKVETFKSDNDIIDAQGRLISDDEILKLNDQLSTAKARTLELDARAKSMRGVSAEAVLNGASPEAASSGVLTELRTQYAAAKQEADRLSVRLGPRHPQYQSAQAQVEGARAQIATELRRINAQVQTELTRAVQLEQELATRLAQLKVKQGSLSGDMVTLRELERDANAKRSVYEAFLLRAKETGEQKSLNTANITEISRASPPLESAGPSRAVIAGVGTLLGLLAGLAIGGARGALDSLRDTGRSRRGEGRNEPALAPRVAAPPSSVSIRQQSSTAVAGPAVPRASTPSAGAASAPTSSAPVRPAAPSAAPSPSPSPRTASTIAPTAAATPVGASSKSSEEPKMYPPQYPGYPAQPYDPYRQPAPPAPQPYASAQPMAPPGYAPPPYPPQPYPQTFGAPAYPAPPPAYAQPGYPPYAPQGWQPQPSYPPQAFAQQPVQPYPPAWAVPVQQPYPAHPPHQPEASGADAASLAGITESIREFRDAVRELTEGRSRRRYF